MVAFWLHVWGGFFFLSLEKELFGKSMEKVLLLAYKKMYECKQGQNEDT